MDWQPIDTAPYGKVLEVENDCLEAPVLATRGYVVDGVVHADQSFFTSAWTPDFPGWPFPAGRLICAKRWRLPTDAADADAGRDG